MPAVPRVAGDWSMAFGRAAVVVTVAAWAALVVTVLNGQVEGVAGSASVLETAGFLERRGIGADPSFKAQLLLEEVVSNVVRHAFRGDRSRDVHVEVAVGDSAISLVVTDDAPPFDPLRDAPVPDTQAALSERPEGGLGIHLVRRFADEIEYRRLAGENRVRMRVRL